MVKPVIVAPAKAIAYQPPASGTGDGGGTSSAPGKWWPPDRRILAGGISSVVAYTILSYLRVWAGIDLNPLNAILGVVYPGTDLTGLFAMGIGAAVSQITPPKIKDLYLWIDNATIRLANADPNSPVKAMIVNDHASNTAADRDIAAGAVPADIVAKRDSKP